MESVLKLRMLGILDPAKRLQCLMDAVSVRISSEARHHDDSDRVTSRKVDSDHQIAEELGTSIEFVRRQRKFLASRPPVLPQQLKRGIFSMESVHNDRITSRKVGNRYNSAARNALKAWVEKDPDAHLELGLAAIGEQAGVSISTVKRYLADLVAACNGVAPDEVWAQRKAAGFVRGGSRSGPKKKGGLVEATLSSNGDPQRPPSEIITPRKSSERKVEREVSSQPKPKEQKVPTEADLVQATRIALEGPQVAHQLLNMLDALRDGRLLYEVWDNTVPPVGCERTPYKYVWIRNSNS